MSVEIRIEAADGIESILRDEWHSDKDGFVVAYNDGVTNKVTVPTRRVVAIETVSH